MHIDLMHLLQNVLVIWMAGRLAERLYGSIPVLAICILSHMGSCQMNLLSQPFTQSQGASAMGFGLCGSIFAFLLVHRSFFPRQRWTQYMTFVLLAFAIGVTVVWVDFDYAGASIDHLGHLGGALLGFLSGFLLCRTRSAPTVIRFSRPFLLLVGIVGLGMGVTIVQLRSGPVARAWKHLQAAERLTDEEQWEEAHVEASRCLEIDSSVLPAYGVRAKIREELGDFEGGLSDIRRILEVHPRDPSLRLIAASIHTDYGFSLLEKQMVGNARSAFRHFESAIKHLDEILENEETDQHGLEYARKLRNIALDAKAHAERHLELEPE